MMPESQLLTRLREWAADASSFRLTDYDEWARTNDAPSPSTLILRFGSWSEAMRAADLGEHLTSVRQQRRVISDAELWSSVVAYLRTDRERHSFADLGVWMRQQGLPSSATVRARLGKWSEVRETAERVIEYAAAGATGGAADEADGTDDYAAVEADATDDYAAGNATDPTTERATDATTEGAIDATTEGAIDATTEGAADATTEGAADAADDYAAGNATDPTTEGATDAATGGAIDRWDFADEVLSIVPGEGPRREHTDDACFTALQRVATVLEGPITVALYDKVRTPEEPSSGVLMKRYGGWYESLHWASLDDRATSSRV